MQMSIRAVPDPNYRFKCKLRGQLTEEEKRELEDYKTMDPRTVDEMASEFIFCSHYRPGNEDKKDPISLNEAYREGFLYAKKLIINYLNRKSLNYGDTYIFKMDDLYDLGLIKKEK